LAESRHPLKYGTPQDWREVRGQIDRTWTAYVHTLVSLQADLPKTIKSKNASVLQLRSRLKTKQGPTKKSVAESVAALSMSKPLRVLQKDIGRLQLLPKTATSDKHLLALQTQLRHALKLRNKLVERNMGLVAKLAIQLCTKIDCGSLTKQDLIQHGTMGLITSVERFDVARGVAFSSYSMWHIRAAMQQAIADTGRLVRLTSNIEQNIRTIMGGRRADDTENELRDRYSLSPRQYEQLKEARRISRTRTQTSLNEPSRGEEKGATKQDRLQAPDADLDTKLDMAKIQRLLHSKMGLLSAQERTVLCGRFGMCGHEQQTLVAIGAKWNVTRERVRQIEARALRKLQQHLYKQRELWEQMGYEVTKPAKVTKKTKHRKLQPRRKKAVKPRRRRKA